MTETTAMPPVRRNDDQNRFEVEVDGHIAELTFRRRGDVIHYTHTGVPKALEGRGIAGRLATAALEYARDEGLSVVPDCPYVRGYIEKHPEYQDLVRKP